MEKYQQLLENGFTSWTWLEIPSMSTEEQFLLHALMDEMETDELTDYGSLVYTSGEDVLQYNENSYGLEDLTIEELAEALKGLEEKGLVEIDFEEGNVFLTFKIRKNITDENSSNEVKTFEVINKNGPSEKLLTDMRELGKPNESCRLTSVNNCKKCYTEAVTDYYKALPPATFEDAVISAEMVEKNYRKRKDAVTFPTKGYITENNLEDGLLVLKKLLKAKNEVVIMQKPSLDVVTVLCEELKEYKKQVSFYFSTLSEATEKIKKWKPGTPAYEERKSAEEFTLKKGYTVRFLIGEEPRLDINLNFVHTACLSGYYTTTYRTTKL